MTKSSPWQKLRHLPAHTILLIFSVVIFLLQTLPRILSYGVFFDGLTYSSLARNYAEGHGTFWNMYYTDTLYPRFIEHPPLAFALQSVFFSLFGDAFYIETIYGVLTGVIALFLINAIWKLLQKKDISLSGSYAPILMFALYPIITWVYANNMIENTMTVFILSCVYFFIKGLQQPNPKWQIAYISLGSVFLFCAILSKGPVALFPLVLPLFWYFIYRDLSFTKAVVYVMFIFIIMGLLAALFIFPFRDGVSFFRDYLNIQVFRSLAGQREMADSKFVIFKRLFFESLVSVGVAGILYFIFRKPLRIVHNKTMQFVLLIALSGSLPFGMIPKQMGWYLIPTIPFFAMALAALFTNTFAEVEEKLEGRDKAKYVLTSLTVILFLCSFVIMLVEFKAVRKEKDFFNDLVVNRYPFVERTTISTYPPELAVRFSLLANLQRYFKVSITEKLGQRVLISNSEHANDSLLLRQYKRVHPSGKSTYVIFEKKQE